MGDLTALLGPDPSAWAGSAIAVLGSGGKTALITGLARHLARSMPRVLISTLTKVYPFPGVTAVDALDALPEAFRRERVVFFGRKLGDEGKMAGLPEVSLRDLLARADVVLLESDGARRRPFKVHLPHDPVVPPEARLAIVTVGASALGRLIDADTVHRHARAPSHWGLRAGEKLDATTMVRVLLAPDGYLGKAPRCAVRILINQADGYPREAGILAAELSRRWPGAIVVGSARRGDFAGMENPGPRASLILLAAGASERLGDDKRRLVIKGRPLLEWSLAAYREARVLEKIAVLGPEDGELGSLAVRHGFRPVFCLDPSAGMSASLKAGLAERNPEADCLMLALGDMPAVSGATLSALLAAARENPGRAIRPCHQGRAGHPVILPQSAFTEISLLAGDRGARDLMPALAPIHMECEDPGVLLDFDTPADLTAIERCLPEAP